MLEISSQRSLSRSNLVRLRLPGKQQGIVLFIALVILIAMTIGGIALIRSVDTTNLIAGNMSFHQSATLAGEKSTEKALVSWIVPSSLETPPSALYTDNQAKGYLASRADPPVGTTWDDYWTNTLSAKKATLGKDAAGNTVDYVIQRLCDGAGDPAALKCAKSPTSDGNSQTTDSQNITNNQVYYRITTRIAGPRNTVAYIQTIVAK